MDNAIVSTQPAEPTGQAAPDMFDIGSVKTVNSGVLDLTHPITGQAIPAWVELAGANHPKRKACEFARSRALRHKVSKKGRLELTDPQDDADYEVDRLVACTLSWGGFARDGQAIPCTPGEVRAMYENNEWLRVQALEYLGEATNFLQSAKPL